VSAVSSQDKGDVVLVPGLWFGRPALWWLAYRLTRRGFRVHLFPYDSTGRAFGEACADLADYAVAHASRYLVGYSLGGVLVCAVCQHDPTLYTRALALGSPFRGSWAVRRWWRCRFFRWLLGAAAPVLLWGIADTAPAHFGVITGTKPWGIAGLWLKKRVHDGVVLSTETRLRGVADAVALRVSHIGLVTSAKSARLVANYLEHGRFGD